MEAKLSIQPHGSSGSTICRPFRAKLIRHSCFAKRQKYSTIISASSSEKCGPAATHKALATTLVATCLVSCACCCLHSLILPLSVRYPHTACICFGNLLESAFSVGLAALTAAFVLPEALFSSRVPLRISHASFSI